MKRYKVEHACCAKTSVRKKDVPICINRVFTRLEEKYTGLKIINVIIENVYSSDTDYKDITFIYSYKKAIKNETKNKSI